MPIGHDDNDDVKIKGATDDTLIGNEGDALKVTGIFFPDSDILVSPRLDHQAYLDSMKCLQEEILAQLKIISTHLACISDLEDVVNASSEDGST